MTQARESTRRSSAPLEVPAGLEGVIVADTALSDVRGLEGFYHYRAYDATELARTVTLEDVWCLFFNGALPANADEREAFRKKTASYRTIPSALFPILREISSGTDLLAALRTASPSRRTVRWISTRSISGPDSRAP